MWHEAGATPVCKTEQGCPIEAEATDAELESALLQYQYAKILGQQGNTSAETKILDQLGLFDDPLVLLEIENVYLDYVKFQRKKQDLNGRQRNKNISRRR